MITSVELVHAKMSSGKRQYDFCATNISSVVSVRIFIVGLNSLLQELMLWSCSKLRTSGAYLNGVLLDLEAKDPMQMSSSTATKVDVVVCVEMLSQCMSHLSSISMIA